MAELDWYLKYNYMNQFAFYSILVELDTGKQKNFFIAGVSKESPCDKALLKVSDKTINEARMNVLENIKYVKPFFLEQKNPVRCEQCAFCRKTKMLDFPVEV